MGPRTLVRGNHSLQTVIRVSSHRFNGAAHSRARKYDLFPNFARRWKASMGPRALVRGNSLETLPLELLRQASMGPRTLVRGNTPYREAICQALRCFNGAAHSRARKWRSLELLNFQ